MVKSITKTLTIKYDTEEEVLMEALKEYASDIEGVEGWAHKSKETQLKKFRHATIIRKLIERFRLENVDVS